MLCADVLIDSLPAHVERDVYTYRVPAELLNKIRAGSEVTVPFGKQTKLGYVIQLDQRESPSPKLKDLLDITGQQYLSPQYLNWLQQIAAYYLCSLSQVIGAAIPRRLSARLRQMVEPRPHAAGFLKQVKQHFGPESELHDFASFLVSSAPQWKTKKSCQRRFGKAADAWLKVFHKMELVDIYTQVQRKPEPKEQLTLRYVQHLEVLTSRQRQLLDALREQAPILLSEFCESQNTTAPTLRRLESLGALKLVKERIMRTPEGPGGGKAMQKLTPKQHKVFVRIAREMKAPSGKPILLHGVTGSGKTEVYLHCLQEALNKGEGGMFLVPEIALTPQMLRRCRAAFGEHVAVLHSGLSDGEYLDEWERVRNGSARIVVGARSAVFAPIPRLRLIVVDEEHENSYKQDSYLRYDARRIALMRMRNEGGVVVFGSATPRIESYYQATQGQWIYQQLKQRVHERPMPPVYVVDMREQQSQGNFSAFSPHLQQSLQEVLSRGEQAILLLNRRGYTGSWMCRDCGESVQCELCAVSLTYHHHEQRLKCHYCDYRTRPPRHCPQCQSPNIKGFGLGTQKLEELTQKLFPRARLLRMDRDSTSTKNAHAQILSAFAEGEADILIGTQMVAKGLDFPRVTLVGILAADQALNLPDFRAGERTFQLLTQAAGRAGRSDLPGRIVLQTYAPQHPAIHHAIRHDYLSFFREERQERKQLDYPPFGELTRLLWADPNLDRVLKVANDFCRELRQRGDAQLQVLGPIEAPLSQLQSLYRVHAIVKHPDLERIKALLNQMQGRYYKEVQRMHIDIDPYSML